MTSSLQQTFETLATSRNKAAVPTLIAAFGSDDRTIHDGAMVALLRRRNKAGHLAVLAKLEQLDPEQRELLLIGRGRMGGAFRDAVVSGEDKLFTNACELIECHTEFDLIPSLITVAEDKASAHADEASKVISRLIAHLSAMVRGPRDYSDRRDPSRMQQYVLESLIRSIERYNQHHRNDLVEAFVILSGASSSKLHTLIDAPHHVCFQAVLNSLMVQYLTRLSWLKL